MKYSLFLIANDNSARWGGLQVVGDDFNRWRSIRIRILFSFSIYTQKCQNIIVEHLRNVNGALFGSYREKISF